MPAIRYLTTFLGAAIALGAPLLGCLPAHAQSALEVFLSPTIGNLKLALPYDAALYPSVPVEGQNADMGFIQNRLRLLVPITQNDRFEWAAVGQFKALTFKTDAILPDSQVPFPEDLWDLQFGTVARGKLKNDWILGGDIVIGSPSDRLFGGIHEMSINADVFLRVPWKPNLAWTFDLNYSNIREIFPGYPLPGVMLSYNPTETLQLLAGVPISSVRWNATPDLQLFASYLVLRKIHAEASHRLWGPLWLTAAYDWDNQRFLLYDRTDTDARLSYYEMRATGGLRWDVTRQIFVEASGGLAFNRFWFQGKTYRDRNDDRINLENGPVVLLRLSGRF
jgi:hypothetical protein